MVIGQESRSEATKQAILNAAGSLFAKRGFNAVTMREIAKEAGFSHTTIYIYFKDKETLLYQLSAGPLQELREQMAALLHDVGLTPATCLKSVSKLFIEFCLNNRTMYTVFFMTKGTRVDEEAPALEIQKLRLQLFDLLKQTIQTALALDKDNDQLLAYSRIFFYMLQGIIATYTESEESPEQILARLESTFDLAIDVMLLGFLQTKIKGDQFE